jgi:hypothetical protein
MNLGGLKLRQTPIRINGDDLLVPGNSKTQEALRRRGKVVGLIESVGKSYDNNLYANINSQSFRVSRKWRPEARRVSWCFTFIPMINMGLMLGLKRSSVEDREELSVADLGDLATELIEAAPRSLRNRVLKEFMERHKGSLKDTQQPYFLPKNVGGLGLPLIGNDGTIFEQFASKQAEIVERKIREEVVEMSREDKLSEDDIQREVEDFVNNEMEEFLDQRVSKRFQPSALDLRLAKAVLVKNKKVLPTTSIKNWHQWTNLMKKFDTMRFEKSDKRLQVAQMATNCLIVDQLVTMPLEQVYNRISISKAWAKFNSKLYDPKSQRPSGGRVLLTRIFSVLKKTTLTLAVFTGKNLSLQDVGEKDE